MTGELSRVGFVSDTGAVEYRVSSFFPHPNQLAGFVVLFVPLASGSMRSSRAGWPGRRACCWLCSRSRPRSSPTRAACSWRWWPSCSCSRGASAPGPRSRLPPSSSSCLAPAAWQDRLADAGRLDRPEIATRPRLLGRSGHHVPGPSGGRRRPQQLRRRLRRAGHDGPELPPGTGLAPPESAHSLYLNTLAEQGLVGIAALLLLILAAGAWCRSAPLGRRQGPRFRARPARSGDTAARLEPLRRDLRRPEDLDARLDAPRRRRGAPAHRRARADVRRVKGDILFYSDFPYPFHNTEAEEKMARFAARGWRVVYVAQLGIRNPRPSHVVRALRRGKSPAQEPPFEVVRPKLVPPRRVPGVDAVNRRWLARQLLGHVRDPEQHCPLDPLPDAGARPSAGRRALARRRLRGGGRPRGRTRHDRPPARSVPPRRGRHPRPRRRRLRLVGAAGWSCSPCGTRTSGSPPLPWTCRSWRRSP